MYTCSQLCLSLSPLSGDVTASDVWALSLSSVLTSLSAGIVSLLVVQGRWVLGRWRKRASFPRAFVSCTRLSVNSYRCRGHSVVLAPRVPLVYGEIGTDDDRIWTHIRLRGSDILSPPLLLLFSWPSKIKVNHMYSCMYSHTFICRTYWR